MRRNPPGGKIFMVLVGALFLLMQAAAVAQACDTALRSGHVHSPDAVHAMNCTQAGGGTLHCELHHDIVCAEYLAGIGTGSVESKAAWPSLPMPAAPAVSFSFDALAAADARASPLSRFAPEVPHLSIAQLNLRQ